MHQSQFPCQVRIGGGLECHGTQCGWERVRAGNKGRMKREWKKRTGKEENTAVGDKCNRRKEKRR